MTNGHNNPPSQIETVHETARALSDWMAERPIIESEEIAREAKVFIDRGKLALADLETERDSKVRPLNEQVKEINTAYKRPRDILSGVVAEIQARISRFIRAEEERRVAVAQEAARIARESELRAREAERLELEAFERASVGELSVDITAHVAAANSAFAAFQKADREAARAEKETKVKIGGGFKNALSLRQKETLVIEDHEKAVKALGLTDAIKEAIFTSARAYRTQFEELPPGVISQKERTL
jgi:hypothetical protein